MNGSHAGIDCGGLALAVEEEVGGALKVGEGAGDSLVFGLGGWRVKWRQEAMQGKEGRRWQV